jgi:HEPN domain-containing protein
MRPPERVKRDLVRQWLRKAEADLSAAKVLLAHGGKHYLAAAFHAQQASEKYLKAFLTERQVEFPKTHDLDRLLELVASAEPGLSRSLKGAVDLTRYAVDARYPGDFPEVTAKDARRAVRLAASVSARIAAALGGSACDKEAAKSGASRKRARRRSTKRLGALEKRRRSALRNPP